MAELDPAVAERAASREAVRRGLASPAGVSLIGKGAEAATLTLLVVLVPRVLGPTDYGRFAAALSVAAIASSALSLGGPALLSRFVPAAAPADRPRVARTLTARLARVRLLLVLLVAAAALVLTTVDPDRFPPSTTALVTLAIALDAAATLGYQVALGLGHTSFWSFRFPVQNLVLVVSALVLYDLAGATGAIAGIVIASGVALVLGGAVAARRLRGVPGDAPIPQGALRFGVLQAVSGLFVQVTHRGAPVAVFLLAGSASEAGFSALATGVALALTYAAWQPFLAELPGLAARVEAAPEAVESAARRLATLGTAALVPLGLLGALLVDPGLPLLVGDAYKDAVPACGPALAILPLAPLSALAAQLAALRLRPGARALASAVAAVAFVVTATVAVPEWESVGGAAALLVATVATIAVSTALLPGMFGRRLYALAFGGAGAILLVSSVS